MRHAMRREKAQRLNALVFVASGGDDKEAVKRWNLPRRPRIRGAAEAQRTWGRRDTHRVSLALLHQLAQAELPVTVFSGKEVDSLRVLLLAGHIQAHIPLPVRTLSGHDQPPATVKAVTSLGRQMVHRFPLRRAG